MGRLSKYIMAIVAALVHTGQSVHAQQTEQTEITHAICEAARNAQTMQCDFSMTRKNKMLKDAAIMRGKMTTSQPNCIYWECAEPKKIIFTTNGEKVRIIKDGKTSITDLNENRIFKRIKRLTSNGIGVDNLIKSENFSVTTSETQTEWIVTLTPLRKELKQFLTALTLHADKKDAIVKKIELQGKNGDSTTMVIENIKINGDTDASLFDF